MPGYIHASNDGSNAYAFTVRNAAFRDNARGLYALNTGFATILSCDFAIGGGTDCAYGILADHATGFCIEENTFRPYGQGNGERETRWTARGATRPYRATASAARPAPAKR